MVRMKNILDYWFGRVEETVIPTENRARIWFGESDDIDQEIKLRFNDDLKNAMVGDYNEWEKSSRSQLALIITLDQFSRHIFRGQPSAYTQDDYALSI